MKLINIAGAICMSVVVFVSCTSVPGERMVLARQDQIYENTKVFPDKNPETNEPEAALVSMDEFPGAIRDAVNSFFGEEVSELILTDERFIKPEELSLVFHLTPQAYGETGDVDYTWLQQLVPVIGGAIPGSAPVLGLLSYGLALFSRKRSRQHLGDAFKRFTPIDGSVQLKDGFNSLGKAVGLSHSTESSEQLFALASKKRAEEQEALYKKKQEIEAQLEAKKVA